MSPVPTLLIVDDDPDAQYLLAHSLTRAGIHLQLDTALDADGAIDYFQSCVTGELAWPYVVFLDVKMPGRDGFTVLEWLREAGLLGNTVVAMMTTSDSPADVTRAFSLGAHTYLSKGVKPEILGPIVRSAISLAEQSRRTPRE